VWLVIRETFEHGAQRHGDVQDRHELDLVLGEADVRGDGREERVNKCYHCDEGVEGRMETERTILYDVFHWDDGMKDEWEERRSQSSAAHLTTPS